jgi:hypothetical protein
MCLSRERFDLSQVFVTGMQHAGTAATALMAEIVIQTDVAERKDLLENLTSIRATLDLMVKIYQQAIVMISVIDHFVQDLQGGGESSTLINDEGTNGYLRDRERFPGSSASFNPSISNLTCDTTPSTLIPTSHTNSSSQKRPYKGSSLGPASKRPHRTAHLSNSIFTPRTSRCQSPKNLPFLPNSWLEELDFEDSEFLSLMGVKNHDAIAVGLEGGLLSSSCFPGDGDFGALD